MEQKILSNAKTSKTNEDPDLFDHREFFFINNSILIIFIKIIYDA